MDVPGPGGLRYMKVQRPVILPAVSHPGSDGGWISF